MEYITAHDTNVFNLIRTCESNRIYLKPFEKKFLSQVKLKSTKNVKDKSLSTLITIATESTQRRNKSEGRK
jgi:hypothetical protein